jgi:hypothetical protein
MGHSDMANEDYQFSSLGPEQKQVYAGWEERLEGKEIHIKYGTGKKYGSGYKYYQVLQVLNDVPIPNFSYGEFANT